MGWFSDVVARLGGGSRTAEPELTVPPPPTSADILASVERVEQQIEGRVPPAVTARVHRITGTVEDMVPRLDRLSGGSQQAHTVVATATSYLPEAVGAYLRLPRDFADRRVVAQGKTSLMLLCDQLDLLGVTLDKISDAVSRADAAALVAHGAFLAEKFRDSSIALDAGAGRGTPQPSAAPPAEPGRLEAP
ncbi:hypothetical protein [Cellulosimicrobium marinum]|uniref:hypothetical protein n=1 Tax=Cellulosimicrobium marinum TaxID=1638992 RepID=UPI001E2850F7|nr:hypothetical protein [Cellulosimicrobium marinum]MCB7136379.1 hypothetical protein [Cellulosimicrobium marinum]